MSRRQDWAGYPKETHTRDQFALTNAGTTVGIFTSYLSGLVIKKPVSFWRQKVQSSRCLHKSSDQCTRPPTAGRRRESFTKKTAKRRFFGVLGSWDCKSKGREKTAAWTLFIYFFLSNILYLCLFLWEWLWRRSWAVSQMWHDVGAGLLPTTSAAPLVGRERC